MNADPPHQDSDSAPQGDPPLLEEETQLFENIVFLKSDGADASLTQRLSDALARALGRTQRLVLLTAIQPIAVRAAQPADVVPAELELPDQLGDLLGIDLEARVMIGAGETRIWLAGADRVPTGATITVVGIGAEEETVVASVEVGEPVGPIEIILAQEVSGTIALSVSENPA